MKAIFNLKKSIFFVAVLLGAAVSMTSCDDDDDKNEVPTEVKVGDEVGTYSGKLTILAPAETYAEAAEGITVTPKVEKDTVWFDKFYVTEIVKAVVPEAEVEAVLTAIGDQAHKVGYEAAQNSAKDALVLTFDPKPWVIEYTIGEGEDAADHKIEVTFEKVDGATYASKSFKFSLKLATLKLDDAAPEGYIAPTYKFELVKP